MQAGTTARLEEAIVAYRAALEERTRARVPLDSAMTQNNLGTALSALGQRTEVIAPLRTRTNVRRLIGSPCLRRLSSDRDGWTAAKAWRVKSAWCRQGGHHSREVVPWNSGSSAD
jgi:hypothetical protein